MQGPPIGAIAINPTYIVFVIRQEGSGFPSCRASISKYAQWEALLTRAKVAMKLVRVPSTCTAATSPAQTLP